MTATPKPILASPPLAPSSPGASLLLPSTHLRFPCDIDSARQGAREACWFLATQGAYPEELRAWELLLTEAVANAVQHTSADRRGVQIEILLVVHPGEIEAHVIDHGQGFRLPDCVELPEDLEESGRGLYVIRSMVDRLDYQVGNGANRLILTRARVAPEAGTEISPPQCMRPEQVATILLEHDLKLARSIQQAFLPRQLPQPPGATLAGRSLSAREVGGDFFDVLRWGESGLLLVVADVMGKGMSAALVAGMLRSHVHALQEWAIRPGDLLGKINQRLYPDLDSVEMFITAQLVFVDVARRTGRLASAGHGPLLVVGGGSAAVRSVGADGLPLGVLPAQVYAQSDFGWGPGGGFLMHTDGLPDCRDEQGAFFGMARLTDWCRKAFSQGRTADELALDLESTFTAFRGSQPPRDDETFVIFADNPVAP